VTVTGTPDFVYYNSDKTLRYNGNGTLVASNVSGCGSVIKNGDSFSLLGAYATSPGPTITSP
jgi:hypothetical protein